MPHPRTIELGQGSATTHLAILHEDRAALALDKPAGWLLVPFSWQRTQRNLQAAIASAIGAGAYWARSRNLKFLRPVHRLDGDTSGVLLLARNPGALETLGRVFETRRMSKLYFAIVTPAPKKSSWTCTTAISPVAGQPGRMQLDARAGKEASTSFEVLQTLGQLALVAARPVTGRTHQIRLHLLEAGCPIVGDDLYGPEAAALARRSRLQDPEFPIGLRAAALAYSNPFDHRPVRITAPVDRFVKAFGLDPAAAETVLDHFAVELRRPFAPKSAPCSKPPKPSSWPPSSRPPRSPSPPS